MASKRRRKTGAATLAHLAVLVLVPALALLPALALTFTALTEALGQSARPTPTTAPPPAPPKASILVDAETGYVLAAHNHHQALPPASTVKLMTALVAIEKLRPGSTVAVSERTATRPAMRISMKVGEQWPLADVLRSMLMVSANDAAYALAEAASGSIEEFATQAQATATRYGMRDSIFNDPAGLDDSYSYDGGSLMSAYDLAIAARNVLAVSDLASITKASDYQFTGPDSAPHTLTNHNKLITTRPYEGAIGLKTGRTSKAGSTLVAAARRDGRTLIAVVLNAGDIYGAATALLDRGFAMPTDAKGTSERLPGERVKPAAATPKPTQLAAGDQQAQRSGAGDAGLPLGRWLANLGKIILVLAAVAIVLRRRAVRRRRKRRLQRQRVLAEARRRGTLDVVNPVTYDQGHLQIRED